MNYSNAYVTGYTGAKEVNKALSWTLSFSAKNLKSVFSH